MMEINRTVPDPTIDPIHLLDDRAACQGCGAKNERSDDGKSGLWNHKDDCTYLANTMEEKSIIVRITPSDEFLSDVLITAFDGHYGGCWYWAESAYPLSSEGSKRKWLTTNGDEDILKQRWLQVLISESGDDEDVVYYINHSVVLNGIRRVLAGNYGSHAATLLSAIKEDDAGQVDAELADVIIQVAIYNEIVFG